MAEKRPCAVCGGPVSGPARPADKEPFCCPEHRRQRDSERKRGQGTSAPLISPDEHVKQKELRAYESKIRDNVGRTAILCDLLTASVERIDAKGIKPYKPPPQKTRHDPETMVVLRSDLHAGLLTPTYNLDVFKRRMQYFTERIIRIRDLISQTIPLEKLVIINLGDLISGQGIYPNQAWESEKHVLEQIYHEAAPAIIAQDRALLDYFPAVEEHFVPGNHGRTGKDMHNRANFDTILGQDILARFENVERMSVNVEWGWWKFVEVYGHKLLCLHGDLIYSVFGIPFYGLVTRGMRWQGSIPGGPWRYLVHGHFHTPMFMPWNDWELIGNGTLVSDDEFALKKMGLSSDPAQWVFGMHPKHGVSWRYLLNLA